MPNFSEIVGSCPADIETTVRQAKIFMKTPYFVVVFYILVMISFKTSNFFQEGQNKQISQKLVSSRLKTTFAVKF